MSITQLQPIPAALFPSRLSPFSLQAGKLETFHLGATRELEQGMTLFTTWNCYNGRSRIDSGKGMT